MRKALLCSVLALVYLLPGSKIAEAKIDSSNNASSDITVAEDVSDVASMEYNNAKFSESEAALAQAEENSVDDSKITDPDVLEEHQYDLQEIPTQSDETTENNTDDGYVLYENVDDNTPNAIDDTEKDAINKIIYCELERDEFISFISNPDLDLLTPKKAKACCKSETDPGCIQFEDAKTGQIFGSAEEGLARFGLYPSMIIYGSLIDFAGNRENLESYLHENGIQENIETVYFLLSPDFPVTIWVKTLSESYFIALEDVDCSGKYTYLLYSQANYLEKYHPKSASIIVNGQTIINNEKGLLHENYLYYLDDYFSYLNYADIPFLAVMKALGANVEYQDNSIVEINYCSITYILNMLDHSLSKYDESVPDTEERAPLSVYSSGNVIEAVPVYVPYRYEANNDYWIDSITLRRAFSELDLNISIDIDYETQQIIITG